jgi:hypothetical protein
MKGMRAYKHNQGGPKWKVFKRCNAKIQAQAVGGKEGQTGDKKT